MRKVLAINLIDRNPCTLCSRKGKKRSDGIDDSGGCSKVSRKGRWPPIGRFRFISRARSVRWYYSNSKGVPGIGCPRWSNERQWGLETNKISTALSSCPIPCAPLFRRTLEPTGAEKEKENKRGPRFNII